MAQQLALDEGHLRGGQVDMLTARTLMNPPGLFGVKRLVLTDLDSVDAAGAGKRVIVLGKGRERLL